jgi:hypothetical protein
LPKPIQEAPELQLGLELFYGAFFDLASCRTSGMGEGPIPWSAIRDYCVTFEIEGEQREDMFYHVRALDVAYLERQAEKHKATSARSKRGKK